MRMIHVRAEEGRFEAVIFTEDCDAPAEDFVGDRATAREGFAVDFDEEVDLPVGFLPSDSDVYIKSIA